MILLFWQWRPITDVVWSVESAIGRGLLIGLSMLGWLIVLRHPTMDGAARGGCWMLLNRRLVKR